MPEQLRIEVLLAGKRPAREAADAVIEILAAAGATLRNKGRVSLSFEIEAGPFEAVFGIAPGALRHDDTIPVPTVLKDHVDTIAIPRRHIYF